MEVFIHVYVCLHVCYACMHACMLDFIMMFATLPPELLGSTYGPYPSHGYVTVKHVVLLIQPGTGSTQVLKCAGSLGNVEAESEYLLLLFLRAAGIRMLECGPKPCSNCEGPYIIGAFLEGLGLVRHDVAV